PTSSPPDPSNRPSGPGPAPLQLSSPDSSTAIVRRERSARSDSLGRPRRISSATAPPAWNLRELAVTSQARAEQAVDQDRTSTPLLQPIVLGHTFDGQNL